MGWIRVWPGADPAGHDALRHRRHPAIAGRRFEIPEAVLKVKFSYNWISELVDGLDLTPRDLERLITMKTAECEGIEEVGALLGGASAAKVLSVDPMGGGHNRKAVVETMRYGVKTVVCGAPNCRAGMATVYVPLGKKTIGGSESDGMLASGAELGINRDSAGIVELESEWVLKADHVIEIDNK